MSNLDPRISGYLLDIAERTRRILQFTDGVAFAEFVTSTLLQDAVLRNFEVIGEASGLLLRNHDLFVDSHPSLPLRAAYGLRNRLAHNYREVNLEVVWTAIQRDLPQLLVQIAEILEAD
jgi:uncharacterized protein with HEPN domain